MREAVEPGFVEAIGKDFTCADAAAIGEVEFKVAPVPGGVWVHWGLGIAEGVEEGGEGGDLVCDFGFAFGVRGEPEELGDEQASAGGLA